MSLDIFAAFATDENLENHGAWNDIGSGASLLIARLGNRSYAKLLTAAVVEHREALDKDDESAQAKNDEIMIDCLAKSVLLGWKGIAYKGKALDYSVANARTLLSHADFRKKVIGLADKFETFKVKEELEQGEA